MEIPSIRHLRVWVDRRMRLQFAPALAKSSSESRRFTRLSVGLVDSREPKGALKWNAKQAP